MTCRQVLPLRQPCTATRLPTINHQPPTTNHVSVGLRARAAAGIEESTETRRQEREREKLADMYDGFDMRVRDWMEVIPSLASPLFCVALLVPCLDPLFIPPHSFHLCGATHDAHYRPCNP